VDGAEGPRRRRPVSSPLLSSGFGSAAGKKLPGSCWGVEKLQRERVVSGDTVLLLVLSQDLGVVGEV
jgi:hypothetical protein